MQLTTTSREGWRGAKKAEALFEAGADNPTVQDHLRKLKQVETFRKYGVAWIEIQSLVGISRATYCRGKKHLKREGLKGLVLKSR